MKKKTYIKEGVYQKSNKVIKGALDLNKEVLDTLVSKDLVGTVDCCSYFITVNPIEVANASTPTPEEIAHVPVNALVMTTSGDERALLIKLNKDGDYFLIEFG